MNVVLSAGRVLDEVIVIGYGTQKKSDKTGAVSHVKSEELNMGRLDDPIQALQGKAAGVNISKQGGDPNAGYTVNIRGASSFTAGTEPLFVVDGVPGVDPTTIAPEDIESFNVLKDASSTAIYGSRGSNGVVIITTKNASIQDGKGKVNNLSYSGLVSFDNISKKLNFLTGDQIRDFAAETGRTFIDGGANTDWQDEIFRSGITQSHTLSFSGADHNSNYRASVSHNDLTGVLTGSGKTRTIGRLNYTQKVLDDRLTLSARLSQTIEHNDYVNYGNGTSPNNVIYQTYRRSPTDPIFNEDGSYFETDRSFQYNNPVAIINQFQNERDAKRFLGNLRADLEIFDGLIGSVNMGYTRDDEDKYYFEPASSPANNTNGLGNREYKDAEGKLIESTLNFTKQLGGIHNVNLLAGHAYQIDVYDGFKAEGKNASSELLEAFNLGQFKDWDYGNVSSYKNEAILVSLFGRAVYDYDGKYFLTASLRRDGSSKFGADSEWGLFPSLSLGWNILGEDFLKNSSLFDILKLRVGYGVSGNQNIDVNIDKATVAPSSVQIDPETGQEVVVFVNPEDIEQNPKLQWEQNTEINAGIDFGILKNRLSGTIEYYNKTINNLIYKYEQPVPPNKNRYIYGNAGEIVNSGFEVTLQGYPVNRKNIDWKSILTFTANQQETKSLSSDEFELEEIKTLYVEGRGLVGGENWTQIIKEGYEVGTFFLPEYAGLSDDGKFLFYTEAGGVTRFVENAERRVVGHAQPDFSLGWSNFFTFADKFDASISMRAVVGFDVLNVTRMVFSNPADLPTLNVLEEALDEYERGLTSSPIVSSYYIEDGTFLKIDNATLGYTLDFPNQKLIKNIRVYLSGSNLLTLTNYTGVDPELNYGGLEFGRDQYDVYPKTRTISVGINANF
jgi:iron complex outermembrane receptor protein